MTSGSWLDFGADPDHDAPTAVFKTSNKSEIASLDFVINRFFMKLFQTNNVEIVRACQEFFGFEPPSDLLPKRV